MIINQIFVSGIETKKDTVLVFYLISSVAITTLLGSDSVDDVHQTGSVFSLKKRTFLV